MKFVDFSQTLDYSKVDPDDKLLKSFICPITQELMKEPVMTKYGHLFEREAILAWIRKNQKCPLT